MGKIECKCGLSEGSNVKLNIGFYENKKVMITDHTNIKGSWMFKVLTDVGSLVTSYALEPTTNSSLVGVCGVAYMKESIIGDIWDLGHSR